ncbi:DgyrCDS747 [Dimorphilus gyrociliatus]|uniref:DgyrCDS747 n=1 Tax=Dimorphilus gyrociliatus TaxID=2664684 RepID=A0A7I8V5A2_9ANNE|nr:DgyrCDS747 [Dimorphilus gyrociliatus]
MSNLAEELRETFGNDNLYEILNVNDKVSESNLKKAYHKASLKYHPDRVDEERKAEATKRFQYLGKVYSILSDKEKRKIYDETGEIDGEDIIIDENRDWENYWRLIFKPLTKEDIIAFEKEYKGSEEEKTDIKKAYIEHKGNMDEIMNSVMCSTIDDEDRYRKIIDDLIKTKEVKAFKSYTNESKKKKENRKRKAEEEAAEAEEELRKIRKGKDDDLSSLILARNAQRGNMADDFFKNLEAKYGGNQKKGKKNGKVKKK